MQKALIARRGVGVFFVQRMSLAGQVYSSVAGQRFRSQTHCCKCWRQLESHNGNPHATYDAATTASTSLVFCFLWPVPDKSKGVAVADTVACSSHTDRADAGKQGWQILPPSAVWLLARDDLIGATFRGILGVLHTLYWLPHPPEESKECGYGTHTSRQRFLCQVNSNETQTTPRRAKTQTTERHQQQPRTLV